MIELNLIQVRQTDDHGRKCLLRDNLWSFGTYLSLVQMGLAPAWLVSGIGGLVSDRQRLDLVFVLSAGAPEEETLGQDSTISGCG